MSHSTRSSYPLTDTHQTVWQLSVIQLSGWMSLPILATSVLILQENSFYGAILTIIVANAILWFIRLGIILMSHQDRQSTLDISKAYLGKTGGYFIGALLIISTLSWFITQTTAASQTLSQLLLIEEGPNIDEFTQMSVLLGVISTLLCMQGMTVLKRLSAFSFPILLVAFLIGLFVVPFQLPPQANVSLSLSGLSLVLGTNLGLTSDLPTFFRHSRSIKTSVAALTVVQLVTLCLAIGSLYFSSIITSHFEVNTQTIFALDNSLLRMVMIVFVFFSVICANVANVYSASVGWEVIAPKALIGRKEYLILGLGLTTIFVLISNLISVDVLLEASDSSLVNLCLVLIIGYIITRVTNKGPTLFEKQSYFWAWALATLINTLQFCQIAPKEISPLVVGFSLIVAVIACSRMIQAIVRGF